MAAHMTQSPAPIEVKRPDCPSALAALILRCLAKNPDERWQSADDIVNQLRALGETSTPRGSSPRIGRRIAVITGAALLVLAAAMLLRRSAKPGPDATSANVIAVLPFTVRGGPQFAYLGEGIVDLMSASLDGTGSIRSVNAHALLGFVGHEAAAMSVERGGPRGRSLQCRSVRGGRRARGRRQAPA